jgi:hypothetical protein
VSVEPYRLDDDLERILETGCIYDHDHAQGDCEVHD